MADIGYIKLHRKIWDTAILADDERFSRMSAWIWILTHVNYKDASVMIKGNVYKIKRGQMMVSIRFLAETWHWNTRTVMRYLRALETDKMVTRTRTSCATLLTVCNYSKYQGSSDSDSDEYNSQYNSQYNSECNTECNNLKNNNKKVKKEKNNNMRGGRVIE